MESVNSFLLPSSSIIIKIETTTATTTTTTSTLSSSSLLLSRLSMTSTTLSSSSSSTTITSIINQYDNTNTSTNNDNRYDTRPDCYYKNNSTNNRWKKRIELNELYIGQELNGIIVQQLWNNTRTGPKLFLDCGIGRYHPPKKQIQVQKQIQQEQEQEQQYQSMVSNNNKNSIDKNNDDDDDNNDSTDSQKKDNNKEKKKIKNGWKIQTAMLRLDGSSSYRGSTSAAGSGMMTMILSNTNNSDRKKKKQTKESVLRKKVSKLLMKEYITVYVSRLYTSSDQLEVVLKKEEIPTPLQQQQYKPISSLQIGTNYNGTIMEIRDYGILIQINNVNRYGLLHIQSIANSTGTYINKQLGLQEFVLQHGIINNDNTGNNNMMMIEVQVISNNKKRLFLDLSDTIKEKINIKKQQRQQLLLDDNKLFNKKRQQKQGEQQEQQDKEQYTKSKTNPTTTTTTTDASTKLISVPITPTREVEDDSYNNSKENTSTSSMDKTGFTAKTDLKNEDDDNDNIIDVDVDDDEEEYDNYDEERDIEDQLGLGYY